MVRTAITAPTILFTISLKGSDKVDIKKDRLHLWFGQDPREM